VKDDVVYLRHIKESIRRVEENTRSGREEFFSSHTLQDAVLRNLQTLTESTQRLSPDAKAEEPSVDWRAISGFRNVLVHNYLGLDLEQVWIVVTRDVPSLKAAVVAMLSRRES